MPNTPEAYADVVALAIRAEVAPLREKLAALEARLQAPEAALGELAKDCGALREKLAALEVRTLQPGPPGPPGADGKDGLGLEELALAFDGERTLTFTLGAGEAARAVPVVLPHVVYQGVHQSGRSYVRGDAVTWSGSLWHCQEATSSRPGDGSPAWRLCVKEARR